MNKTLRTLFLISVFALLVLSGCSSSEEATLPPQDPDEEIAAPPTQVEPAEEGEVLFPLPAKSLAQRSALDLAARKAIAHDEIQLVSVETVEWSDGSIGCPKEGFDYIQAITPGYRITLEVDGIEYVYHTDEGTFIVLCLTDGPEELPVIPIPKGEGPMDGKPWMPVDPIPTRSP